MPYNLEQYGGGNGSAESAYPAEPSILVPCYEVHVQISSKGQGAHESCYEQNQKHCQSMRKEVPMLE